MARRHRPARLSRVRRIGFRAFARLLNLIGVHGLSCTAHRFLAADIQGFQHRNLGRTPDGGAWLIGFLCPHNRTNIEIITGALGRRSGVQRSHLVVSQSWLGVVKIAVATGIAYFLAGRLGLALRAEPGVAVFWPAAGIAVGALIALGPSARLPVAAAVVVATTTCNLMIGRNAWLAIAFGSINAGQALFTTWLLERWFGSTFKLEDVQRVLGFLEPARLDQLSLRSARQLPLTLLTRQRLLCTCGGFGLRHARWALSRSPRC